MSGRRSPTDRYVFAGEFHYFRLPRPSWPDRLAQVRDLGFEAVSIYVPWNWHEPSPGALDLTGQTLPERDLLGALDAIAGAGLGCIYRPGPFITAEWRDGGIPAWLWTRDPSILALDAAGRSAGAGRPYPALTYAHPGYEGPAVRWLVRSIEAVADYLASRGGPIVHLQLDDEPSYWQQLDDSLALDYNPHLVDPVAGRPSRYADWLLRRHGSLDAINTAHHTEWQRPTSVQPPRVPLVERNELIRHVDWLDFKLDAINEHVVVLEGAVRGAGFDGPVSMLFPYLLPLQAAKFAAFAHDRGLDLELTNECYVSLFGPTESPEQKVAHIIACHETYHMWRGPEQGPAFTMELQGSNSSFIPPSVMEMLYAVTLARGIRGFNIYMLVGGENPAGFENGTSREYDLDAPIGAEGELRPHAEVLARQLRVVRAIEPELLAAEPLRDTWLACYVPYESAALVAGRGAFADAGAAVTGMFSSGDFGLSNVSSLSALLTLADVSWGALDLERSDEEAWRRARQLWVPGLAFMGREVQERLVRWVADGGHLVILPAIPMVDEQMTPCTILARSIFGPADPPAFPPFEAEPAGWSQVRTADGGSLAVQGEVARMIPPEDATPIAWAEDGGVIAFRRPVGAGSATVLGFRLQYHPVGGSDQFVLAAGIVEDACGPRVATAEAPGAVALELAGPAGGLLCVVNPVERHLATRVRYTIPETSEQVSIPVCLPAVEIDGRGARLLPIGIEIGGGRRLRHATAELIERTATDDGSRRLSFASTPGARFEIAIEGPQATLVVVGGRATEQTVRTARSQVFVIHASEPEVAMSLLPSGERDRSGRSS
jgi:beta-galactosidase